MLKSLIKELKTISDKKQATILKKFFKTGKGEYGEGDIFLGVTVRIVRSIAKKYYELNLDKSYQQIAEGRAQKKFVNLTVLNSYWVADDGKHYWFEIIFVDPNHPVIKSDKSLQWLQKKKHHSRVFHGKTSSAQKTRGLRSA